MALRADSIGEAYALRGDPGAARQAWSSGLSRFTAAGSPEAAGVTARLARSPSQLPM